MFFVRDCKVVMIYRWSICAYSLYDFVNNVEVLVGLFVQLLLINAWHVKDKWSICIYLNLWFTTFLKMSHYTNQLAVVFQRDVMDSEMQTLINLAW